MTSVTSRVVGAAIPAEHVAPLDSPEAFGQFYAHTHLTVFRYIYGLYGGPQEDVEDLTAETFMRAWRARGSFEGDDEAALRWVLQIARHLVIDAHRRWGRHGYPDNIDDMALAAQGNGPEEQTLLNEQRRLLGSLLHTLSDKQREILVLRYILGWRVKRIAAHLDMPPNTVSVTIRRTLNRLRSEWPEASPQLVAHDTPINTTWATGVMLDGFKR